MGLGGCSIVCIGKNIANCPKKPQFLPLKCVLFVHCVCCACAVHNRPLYVRVCVWVGVSVCTRL